jgi:hypothetical protein
MQLSRERNETNAKNKFPLHPLPLDVERAFNFSRIFLPRF